MERQRGGALGWAAARIGAGCLLGAAILAGAGVTPSAAVSYPLPVKTVSGLNQSMPDPGVFLDSGEFYAFVTGTGLLESKSSTAAGPWSTPVNVLAANQTIPAWMDLSKPVFAPDMIKTTSGQFVVYFSVALAGIPPANPPGNDSKPAGNSRCIATAESTAPTGPFYIDPDPVVCLKGYGAADDMTGDPANRVLGEGVIDPSPRFATIGGQQELFLVAGQSRIFFHGWVSIDSNGITTTTPLPPGTGSGSINEGVNAARVMYAAVLTFGSDGYTPIVGAYQGQ